MPTLLCWVLSGLSCRNLWRADMHSSLVVSRKYILLSFTHYLWFLPSFYLLFLVISAPWGARCDTEVSFMAKPSQVFYSLDMDQLWVSVLITTDLKNKLLWWDWAPNYSYNNKSVEVILILHPLTISPQVYDPITGSGMNFIWWSRALKPIRKCLGNW